MNFVVSLQDSEDNFYQYSGSALMYLKITQYSNIAKQK